LAENSNLTVLTAEIVSNFVAENKLSLEGLSALIFSVHGVLNKISIGMPEEAKGEGPAKPTAAQIRKSVQQDFLVSFIDGKHYKSIKRHLTTQGYTLERYREEFGLPRDYPTVSPNYSKARSDMAKRMGLGNGARKKVSTVAEKATRKPRSPKA
jgi:predicted transcriptional regulator